MKSSSISLKVTSGTTAHTRLRKSFFLTSPFLFTSQRFHSSFGSLSRFIACGHGGGVWGVWGGGGVWGVRGGGGVWGVWGGGGVWGVWGGDNRRGGGGKQGAP